MVGNGNKVKAMMGQEREVRNLTYVGLKKEEGIYLILR